MNLLVAYWTGKDGVEHDATWNFQNDPPTLADMKEACEFLFLARQRVEARCEQP